MGLSEKPVVLITGCASGIGLALAKKFSKEGKYRLVLTARGPSLRKLSELGFVDNDFTLVRGLDVMSLQGRRVLINEINERWGGVDILINNAGISFRSSMEDMDASEEELQMATNYFGPMGLVREVLPHMRGQRRGKIINISSMSGMMAMPTMGSYSASKFALEGASEALWYELKPWGISVTLVQPGFIRSNSFQNVYRSRKSKETTLYKHYYSNMEGFVARLMKSAFATPEKIATKVHHICEQTTPALRVPATIDAHVFMLIRRVMPRSLYHFILYRMLPRVEEWVPPQKPAHYAQVTSSEDFNEETLEKGPVVSLENARSKKLGNF